MDKPPTERLPKESGRLAFAVAAAIATVLFAVWYVWVAQIMPPLSRSDFITAMYQRLPALQNHDYTTLIARAFEPFGGHIVAYERFLQIINWEFFGYSPHFVKYSALAVLLIGWLSIGRVFILRYGINPGSGVLFVLATWLYASPVIYGLVTWTDSIVPYYSSLVVFCLGANWVARRLRDPNAPAISTTAGTLLFAFAVVIGSGIGWGILPTLAIVWVVSRSWIHKAISQGKILWVVVAAAAAIAALFLLRWGLIELMTAYRQRFLLGDVVDGLKLMFEHPLVYLQFVLAVLATNFVFGDVYTTWPVGLIALIVWAYCVIRLIAAGKTNDSLIWILFTVFGLMSAILTATGRAGFVVTYGYTSAPQNYSVFALPFHIGTIGLAYDVVRLAVRKEFNAGKRLPIEAIGLSAVCLALFAAANYSLLTRLRFYNETMHAMSYTNLNAVIGMSDRNLVLGAEFPAIKNLTEVYQVEVIPAFKALGKYAELTDNFVADSAAFAAEHRIPQPLPAGPAAEKTTACGLRNLPDARVAFAGDDTREKWSTPLFPIGQHGFVRFAGHVLDGASCDTPPDYVIAFDRNGQALCVSRPGTIHATTQEPLWPPHEERGRKGSFDFSCPIKDGDAATHGPFQVAGVWSKSNRHVLLPFDSASNRE